MNRMNNFKMRKFNDFHHNIGISYFTFERHKVTQSRQLTNVAICQMTKPYSVVSVDGVAWTSIPCKAERPLRKRRRIQRCEQMEWHHTSVTSGERCLRFVHTFTLECSLLHSWISEQNKRQITRNNFTVAVAAVVALNRLNKVWKRRVHKYRRIRVFLLKIPSQSLLCAVQAVDKQIEKGVDARQIAK